MEAVRAGVPIRRHLWKDSLTPQAVCGSAQPALLFPNGVDPNLDAEDILAQDWEVGPFGQPAQPGPLSLDSPDKVNHPSHYGGEGNLYETILVLEAWGLDRDFLLGNTVKYISRAGKKDSPLQDLEKAKWYLDRKIASLRST